jgi:D-alanyl-D-alanine carboxypeptidase (penicillin-binding protein 5/6)
VPGALLSKTGFTDAAQHTYVGAARQYGRTLGVVLLRNQRWPKDQWQQAQELFAWAGKLPKGTAPVGHLAGSISDEAPVSGRSLPAQPTEALPAITGVAAPLLTDLPKAGSAAAKASASHAGIGSTWFVGLIGFVGATVLTLRRHRKPVPDEPAPTPSIRRPSVRR